MLTKKDIIKKISSKLKNIKKDICFKIALNFLQDQDTRRQPGQVMYEESDHEDLLEYIERKLKKESKPNKSLSQPIIGVPPYRGNMLDYIEQREKEEGIIKKGKYLQKALILGYKGKFVIHSHLASKYHYDLRLEFPVEDIKDTLETYDIKRQKDTPEPRGDKKDNYVLRSWAVPKHKIPEGKEKLLAIETEPHPMNYIDFKGEIPEGSYGAGTVDIYDSGEFEIKDINFDKSYKIEFKGKKLKGLYNLVKMDGKNFLFFKGKEG